MVDRFLQYLEFEKRVSRHTVVAYAGDLKQYQEFLVAEYGQADPLQAGYQEVRSWLATMMERGMNPHSVNRKKSALQAFYRFLLKDCLIPENPVTRVVAPRMPKRLPVFVEEQRMESLFAQVSYRSDMPFHELRNLMVLEMFYATGMRLSELVSLKLSDVDLYANTIRILGKRNKERIVPFGPHLHTLITQYLQIRSEIIPEPAAVPVFFLTDKGKKMYQKLAYRIVNDYLSTITTMKKKSPHVLRHTFATHMLNKGADLNAIKELLGHANLSATQVYTHNTIGKLKDIYKQAHPKA